MTKKIIKKRRVVVKDPIFTGKILRELAENPNFTIRDFKKRYSLKKKKK